MNIFQVLWRIKIRETSEMIGWLTPPIFNTTKFFFPLISAIPLPQINCYNFFSLYFDNAIATNQLSQVFFFPLHFRNAIAIIFLVATIFFPPISAIPLPQINCHNFFPSNFGLNLIFFPSFSATSLPKLLLNFSPCFRQLGCHNWFPFSHSSFGPFTWQLGRNFRQQEFR